MKRATYDPELRLSEHGALLYEYWRRIRRNSSVDPTWESYPVFYDWAMDSDYTIGNQLRRRNETKPYGPKNCYWEPREGLPSWAPEWCKKWDETVNKLRKQLGLPPLKGGKE